MLEFRVRDLQKSYDGIHRVFRPLSFSCTDAEVIGLCGHNGAGKSTVMKMLATLLQPSAGTVELINYSSESHTDHTSSLSKEKLRPHVGFAAPYLALYEEFTLWEHCVLDTQLRGIRTETEQVEQVIGDFGLWKRRNDVIRSFSSGMKQRARLILALYHRPTLLLLDEPSTNLDEAGSNELHQQLSSLSWPAIRIIASNEQRDLVHCSRFVNVESL